MNDAKALIKAARQLIETDQLMGGQFMPAHRNPLPEVEPADTSTEAAPADAAPADAAPPEAPEKGALPGQEVATADQKAAALKDMDEAEVRNCTLCPLSGSRTHSVFGEGSPDADLVFVGEAPGAEEDRTGRPFVGRAGELLTKMVAAMGLSRRDVYICNILKCRPPENREPNPREVEACWGYLIRQLQIIAPKVIVTLGNPATKTLLDTRTGITRLRGQWQKLPLIGEGLAGIDVMPTFHPAYLLRQYSPDNRRMVWSDLQAVMEKLNLAPGSK